MLRVDDGGDQRAKRSEVSSVRIQVAQPASFATPESSRVGGYGFW